MQTLYNLFTYKKCTYLILELDIVRGLIFPLTVGKRESVRAVHVIWNIQILNVKIWLNMVSKYNSPHKINL